MSASIPNTLPRNTLPPVIRPAHLITTASKIKQFATETSAQVVVSMTSLAAFGALGLAFKLVGAVGTVLASGCTMQNMWRIPAALPTGKITSLFLNKLAKQPNPESNMSLAIHVISASAAAIASAKFLKHVLGYPIQDDAKTIVFTTASFFAISNFLTATTKYEKVQRELMDELETLEEKVDTCTMVAQPE